MIKQYRILRKIVSTKILYSSPQDSVKVINNKNKIKNLKVKICLMSNQK